MLGWPSSGSPASASRPCSGTPAALLTCYPTVGRMSPRLIPYAAHRSVLTNTESKQAEQEFTTLTCIPGNIYYNGIKIQVHSPAQTAHPGTA